MKRFVLAACLLAIGMILSGCSKSASDYNKEGMEYYKTMDYDQAEAYLLKALESDKDNVKFKQNYAMILIQQGKQDEAIEQFNSTISKKTSSKALKNNKSAYRGIGMAYIQKKQYADAIQNFDKALKIKESPEWDTDILYYKANALLLSGDKESAKTIYSDIVKTDTENALVYIAKANIEREEGNYQAAISDYNSALLYNENFEVYIGLAASYINIGDTTEADEALFLATLLDINSDEDKYYLGVVHYYQQKFDSAKAEMEYALASGIEDAYFYLGEICLIQEEYEEALEYFRSYADSTVVESPTVCNDISVCLMKTGNYEEAFQWISKGLEFKNSSVVKELKRNQIACYEGNGELGKALYLLEKYVVEYPGDTAANTEYTFLKGRATPVALEIIAPQASADEVTE